LHQQGQPAMGSKADAVAVESAGAGKEAASAAGVVVRPDFRATLYQPCLSTAKV